MTVRRDEFNGLGGFDERLPRAGAEDWEFCIRARDRGCKLMLDHDIPLLHNDRRLTLRELCKREEWRGLSVGVLARMRPDLYAHNEVVRENAPINSADSPRRRTRKVIKQILATRLMLSTLHSAMGMLEWVVKPERLLYRLYRAVISLHYLRGFRAGFDPVAVTNRPAGKSSS